MTLGELLTQIRDFYLRHFRAVLKEQRQDPAARLVTEGVLRDAQGEIVAEGHLELPMRVDVVVVRDGQVSESFQVTAQHTLAFKPISFQWTGGAAVSVGPFQWEECRVVLRGVTAQSNFKPLADWFLTWFDINDEHGTFISDFQGVVHCLTDPEFRDDSAAFTIDLGSAPPDVFEYLLDALEQTGAKSVQIGQLGGQGEPAQGE